MAATAAASAVRESLTKLTRTRRPLNRTDYLLAATLAFISIPLTASLVLNRAARRELEPTLESWRRRWEDVEPDLWLRLEAISGREGEYSEVLRRRLAVKRGVPYVPAYSRAAPSASVADHPAAEVAAARDYVVNLDALARKPVA